MKRSLVGLLAAVPLCALVVPSAAQETTHPMYFIRQEFVRPAEISDYEAETKRWLADLGQTAAGDDVQWVTVYGPEMGYSYVLPVDNLGGIDLVRGAISASREGAAARWSTLGVGLHTPIDHIETMVIELRPDISYLPRTVDLNLDLPFRKYHWYHVIPGLERNFEEIAGRLVELYQLHGIEHGYRFYETVLGRDLPVFQLVERASSEADYAARTAQIRATVGPEADALFGQFLAFTRRVEVMEGTVMGDLSYPPLDERLSALDVEVDVSR